MENTMGDGQFRKVGETERAGAERVKQETKGEEKATEFQHKVKEIKDRDHLFTEGAHSQDVKKLEKVIQNKRRSFREKNDAICNIATILGIEKNTEAANALIKTIYNHEDIELRANALVHFSRVMGKEGRKLIMNFGKDSGRFSEDFGREEMRIILAPFYGESSIVFLKNTVFGLEKGLEELKNSFEYLPHEKADLTEKLTSLSDLAKFVLINLCDEKALGNKRISEEIKSLGEVDISLLMSIYRTTGNEKLEEELCDILMDGIEDISKRKWLADFLAKGKGGPTVLSTFLSMLLELDEEYGMRKKIASAFHFLGKEAKEELLRIISDKGIFDNMVTNILGVDGACSTKQIRDTLRLISHALSGFEDIDKSFVRILKRRSLTGPQKAFIFSTFETHKIGKGRIVGDLRKLLKKPENEQWIESIENIIAEIRLGEEKEKISKLISEF